MAKSRVAQAGDGNGFTHFFDWVDRKLTPAFGPPHLAPYGEEDTRPSGEAPCPLCGLMMATHIIDHSTSNTVLVCPTGERLPLRAEDAPLDEFGMLASEQRLEKLSKRR